VCCIDLEFDHLSKGRIAWNIVATTQENVARNFGFDRLVDHDDRYGWADEYPDVVYKLWEGSWDEGAPLKDRERGVFADASRIHKINHVGQRYRVEGPHLPSPSPQRTPLLFQAGSSPAGCAFAARNAEGQFIMAPNPAAAGRMAVTATSNGSDWQSRTAAAIRWVGRWLTRWSGERRLLTLPEPVRISALPMQLIQVRVIRDVFSKGKTV
jgi:alkanesulfonate monooxygenase SsuD/methylene tetrahydromethanopterin reductase-like flavin-dependent oxidoreductase (luciferase family)